ncbi:M28 family peptidase [Neolewinella lacunae]|uniref:M28 family peptidase n=1 Tax=Neolewinella lacunae TaxID=1517758 RepID=A0A923PQ10_9BACT|nr:M28 family peptidase [Neolewinella lacunae]MBC6995359.1 M28 family peptidase [Neolewinella lacunae]MDN3633071.1 M28 family peptidase [Neolewinella lacunae]
MKSAIFTFLLFLGGFTLLPGQDAIDRSLPEFSFQTLDLAGEMHFLASDFLAGRRTGSQGNVIAGQYIASQLRAYGYAPINDGSYFQAVQLLQTESPATGSLEVGDLSFTHGEELLIMRGPAASAATGVVFANYGWVDEATNHDDFANIDVKGKIIITRAGIPGDVGQSGIFRGVREKAEIAAARGAVGIFEIYAMPFPWNSFKGYFGGERIGLDDGSPGASIPYGFVRVGDELLTALQGKKNGLKGKMTSSGIRSTKLESFNVGGILEGADPELKDEYMIMTAHFDHVGVGSQGGGAFTEQDSIFNGARDNAFGTISLLAAARAFAEKKPRRSIIILAVTGEELGLLGSRYYAEHPLVPLEKTVFNFNTDGAGYDDKTGISLIGANRTGIDEQVRIAAEVFGKKVISDPAPEQGLFDRSDNVSFAAKGIPALNFSPGITGFSDELFKYYHQVTDNPETIDMVYLREYCQIFTLAARLIANRDTRPVWVAGDKYEAAGLELYKER